jgi:CHAT domain-containing protein
VKCIKYIFFLFAYLQGLSLSAQCPDRDFLWKKVIFLRDSSNVTDSVQLKELLNYANRLKACNYQNDSSSSFLFQRIGAMYFFLNDFEKAVTYTRQAINIIITNQRKPYISETRVLKCYSNLQLYYDSLKQIQNKNEALDSFIAVSIRTKTVDLLTLKFIWERSGYLNHTGDYQRSIRYTEMGISVAKQYGLDTSYITAAIFSNYANALIFSEQYSKASELLQLKIQESIRQNKLIYLGGMYHLLALTYKEEGRYKEAINYFLNAYKYQLRIKYNVGCAESLNTLGFLYFEKLHAQSEALKYYHRALQYANDVEALNIFDNMANVFAFNNQFDSAHYYFQKSFDQISPGMNERTLLKELKIYMDVNLAEYVTNLILDKADAYLRQYYFEKNSNAMNEALRIYEIADLLLDKMKTEQIQSRLFWRTHTRRLYDHAIEAAYLANNQLKAFYFFEKSRAVLLQDQLNQLKTISDADILKQAQIKKKILKLELQRAAMKTSSQPDNEIQDELFVTTQESGQLDQIIREKNPVYYQSFLDTSFISIQDVKTNLLKDHQALLELFEGDSAVYMLFITTSGIYFNKINKIDFDSTVQKYTTYISDQRLLNIKYEEYIHTANHLYQLIFKNIPVPGGRIIISPDSRYFPFEALVATNSKSPVFFLNNHSISYTYSARFLMNDFMSNVPGDGDGFYGVAPVQFKSTSLVSLYGSDQSLIKIGSYFKNANILVIDHATRNNFLRQFSKYKIIQLYTHAADTSANGEPVIFFTDSALYLSELVAENKPHAKLIVLSACETGNGKLYQGEGVFSFNRGFASLGIPSSVTNLWSVDNTSTYRLTELFYKYLSEGMPVDIALQKAKLEFIASSRQNRLPYYWAATIIAGKTEVLVEKKKNTWIYIAVIAILATGISFFGWRKWKARN